MLVYIGLYSQMIKSSLILSTTALIGFIMFQVIILIFVLIFMALFLRTVLKMHKNIVILLCILLIPMENFMKRVLTLKLVVVADRFQIFQ